MRVGIAIVVLLFGCGDDDAGAASEYPPELPLDEAYVSCESAADCEVVELGCCDECNGGVAVAVNTESVAEVTARFSEPASTCSRPDYGCTEIGCPPWELTCEAGACDLHRGSF